MYSNRAGGTYFCFQGQQPILLDNVAESLWNRGVQ